MKISHLLVAVCCGFVGSISYVQADSSASELLHTIAAEAPGKEHTLNELAIALDELLGLERHVTENKHAAKNNIRRLEEESTITSVVTRIVKILNAFNNAINSKANSEAINQLDTALENGLAAKANIPIGANRDSYTLPNHFDDFALLSAIPDVSAFVLKNDLVTELADKADQTDLDDLNRTLQTFHAVIHDPTALQDLQKIENALNSDETTSEPSTLPALTQGFTGYNVTSCPVDTSISDDFDVNMPPLDQLIGIDHNCAIENEMSPCFGLEHTMDVCYPLPEGAVCSSDCTVTGTGDNARCAPPTPDENGHVTSSCDACTLTPDSSIPGGGMACTLKQMPYTSKELACFDATPLCQYLLDTLKSQNGGPPPPPEGDVGSYGGVATESWPSLSSFDTPDNKLSECGTYSVDSAQAYDLIKHNPVSSCYPCVAVQEWVQACTTESSKQTPCNDYTALCDAMDAM